LNRHNSRCRSIYICIYIYVCNGVLGSQDRFVREDRHTYICMYVMEC